MYKKLDGNHLILIVEDSDEDYMALERSLQGATYGHTLCRLKNGDEATDYLFRQGRFAGAENAPRPVLILLDLNLPGTDGREVLARLKMNEDLKSIPVVIITTSSNPQDVDDCYRKGANSYQLKQVNYHNFRVAIRRLMEYWFKDSLLPEPTTEN